MMLASVKGVSIRYHAWVVGIGKSQPLKNSGGCPDNDRPPRGFGNSKRPWLSPSNLPRLLRTARFLYSSIKFSLHSTMLCAFTKPPVLVSHAHGLLSLALLLAALIVQPFG